MDGLGVLLCCVLAIAVCVVIQAVARSTLSLINAITTAKKLGAALQKLPQQDPPNDSDAFYLIQIPVEEDNIGANFTPKLPRILSKITAEQKLVVVKTLTAENEGRLDSFFADFRSNWTIPLQLVKTSAEVTDYGKVCVKYSKKTDESILAKAIRPAILENNPSFGVEHIRDTFRLSQYSVAHHIYLCNMVYGQVQGCCIFVSRRTSGHLRNGR
jgi:hypothetical protein